MNNIDRQYKELLEHILRFGVDKKDRTGTGTKSIFGWQIRHNMKEGFPLLTTKKMHWKSIVIELLWFLRGDTNIKYLVDNGCHIWDGDAYKRYATSHIKEVRKQQRNMRKEGWETVSLDPNYLSQEEFINKIKTDDKFAKKWGDLGPIYGKQWRSWKKPWWVESELSIASGGTHGGSEYRPIYIDQIQNAINLLKTDPDSRRNRVSAWNVGELDQMVLPPCHTDFQFYTRELSRDERIQIYINQYMRGVGKPAGFEDEKLITRNIPTRAISLMWNQRSVDTFLGLPFNIASYALLLEIIAREVNMVPEEIIGNLGDTHLYLNHIEQAKEQIKRVPYDLPTVSFPYTICESYNLGPLPSWKCYVPENFTLENYQSHPAIKAPLSN